MIHWPTVLYAVIPLMNTLAFLRVPIAPLVAEGKSLKLRELLSLHTFRVFMLLMLCAGASELSMAQWYDRGALPAHDDGISLTREMIRIFGEGKEPRQRSTT